MYKRQPAGGDAVGFVLELLREDLAELLEELVLDDAAVDGRDAVDVARVDEREVRHVDEDLLLVPLVGLDDAHARHLGLQIRRSRKLLAQELVPARMYACVNLRSQSEFEFEFEF